MIKCSKNPIKIMDATMESLQSYLNFHGRRATPWQSCHDIPDLERLSMIMARLASNLALPGHCPINKS